MDSTSDSERPPAVSEKPLLDHITTESPEDSYTDSGDPAKLKNAKNIGTTTPEVEGEDNEPVTTIEDYPSTPVSTMDSLFQSLPLTGESREDSTPLPPTPEEPEFRVNEGAETTSLSPHTEAEGKQLDGAEEPQSEVREDSDMAGGKVEPKPSEGEEVVEADEKVEVSESSEAKQGPSEVKAADLEIGGKGLETLVEKIEEESAPEAANLKILEPNAPEGEPSGGAPGANGEMPTSLDASDFDPEASRAAEPVQGDDGKSGDTPAAEVAEDVAEKLSSEIIDTKHQDNAEAQTIQDPEPAIDEPKAEKAAYGSERDSKVQQEHEAKEAEHLEVTESAMGNTDPNTKTAEHTPDAVVEAVVEKLEDGEVRPEAGETDTAIGDYESKLVLEAVPVSEADSVPSLEKGSAVEGFGVAQSEATDSEAIDAPEPVASSEAKEAEETGSGVTGTVDTEPEKEELLLEKSTEVAQELKYEVDDEPERDPEALREESEEELKGEEEPKTTETTGAEPPTMEVSSLNEPSKEEVSISSAAGEDTSDSELAEESTENAKGESKTNELAEPEPQTAGVLPVAEPSKEGDDSPSVEADARVEPEPTEESKEDMKVETEYEVEKDPESEAAEISEPVEADPAVPDTLPPTEAPKEEVPSIDVNANPQSEPFEEPKEGEAEALKAELLEGSAETAGETCNSTSEELQAWEGAGAPAPTGILLDGGSDQELKGAVAAELEAPAVPEQSTEPEESKEPQNAPEFTGQSVGGEEMGPELDVPEGKEQETQEAVQTTSILDKAEPEESEHNPADAGPEASIGEGEETTKSEPVTGPEPKGIFTEIPVEEDELPEPVEVPTVVVEKTVENQPSYGEDLGPDATLGQKEAFEMRKADAEPDEVIMTEESPMPQIVSVEESTLEPTLDDSGEASSQPTDGIKAESATDSATDSAANEKGEDLAQDEPVVVSHDDAPPGEVEEAEAAVEYPRPDPQGEAAETPKEAEAARDGEPPVSPEQKYHDEIGGESSVEEPVAVAAVAAEETTVSGTDDGKDLPQETSAGPAPVSGSSDPASATGDDKVQVQTGPEETEEVTEAAAGSLPLGEPQPFETTSDIVAEHVPTPRTEEPGVVAPAETNDKTKEPTLPKEPEEAPVAQEIAHSIEPTRETPEESVVDSSTGPGIKLDQDSRESVTSGPTTPEGTRRVVKEEASAQELEEKKQEFSVSPLPASNTAGNPIDLAPGEKVPEEFKVSAEDTIQTEDNPSEPTSAKPSEIPLLVTGDIKSAVQPEALAGSQPEEQIFSVNPLPDSKTFGNPINLRPGEPIPICLTEASVADNVKLDEEVFKKLEDKTPVAEKAHAERSDDGTGEKILATGVGAGLVGLGAYAAVTHFDDETEAGNQSPEKASPVAASPTYPKIEVEPPAVDASANSIPSTAQGQVLPVEASFTTPAIPGELSESPVVPKTEIEPAHPVDRSTEEIKPAGTEVLDKTPLQASAIDILDDSPVGQSVGKSGSNEAGEAIPEPAPQNAPSSVHGLAAPEEHVPKALKDTEASETPAIVVSAPPNPATGSGTAEVIQPSSSEVAFNEAAANKARESENTPEGVRRRRAPGVGGEVSRPTSSGADTVSTRHHRNIMNGFWDVVLFGWLRGFGRFFGGIFSKSKSRGQRK